MEPIYEATKLLSGSSYPTQGDLRIAFKIIMEIIESKSTANPPTIQSLIANAMKNKISNYWNYLDQNSTISAIIDPSHKLETFDDNLNEVKRMFEEKYKSYTTTTTTTTTTTSSSETLIEENLNSSNSSRNYFRKKLKLSRNNNNSTHDILDIYLNTPEEDVDPLIWYKAREGNPKYSILLKIARDYLSIQATSVPSEQAFSIAKNTINPTRNRLDPEKARAMLCLKSWIDNGLVSLKNT